MRARAYSSFFVFGCGVALALGACGGDGGGGDDIDSGITVTDSNTGSDGMEGGECNPVAQTGCSPDEKCATLVESEEPFLARTTCVPNGDVPEGGACERGEAGATTGFDDCERGTQCRNMVCTEICQQAPNSCVDGNCVLISTMFQDLEGIGLCAAACDPVTQDCTGDDACYLNTSLGEAACSRVPEEAAALMQDDDCYGPEEGVCYLNGCAEGFGAVLNKGGPDGPGGSVCAAFCSPVTQHTGDTTALGGDPSGVTCASRGAVSHECRFISTFYSNTQQVPDSIGMCVPPDLWGSCANHTLGSMDPETFVPGCEPLAQAVAPNVPAGVTLPVFDGDVTAIPALP